MEPAEAGTGGEPAAMRHAKEFHVSPFNDMPGSTCSRFAEEGPHVDDLHRPAQAGPDRLSSRPAPGKANRSPAGPSAAALLRHPLRPWLHHAPHSRPGGACCTCAGGSPCSGDRNRAAQTPWFAVRPDRAQRKAMGAVLSAAVLHQGRHAARRAARRAGGLLRRRHARSDGNRSGSGITVSSPGSHWAATSGSARPCVDGDAETGTCHPPARTADRQPRGAVRRVDRSSPGWGASGIGRRTCCRPNSRRQQPAEHSTTITI